MNHGTTIKAQYFFKFINIYYTVKIPEEKIIGNNKNIGTCFIVCVSRL